MARGPWPVARGPWPSGKVLGVQPRIRLNRSFDQRNHDYLGYTLELAGSIGDRKDTFLVAVGKAAQAKHGFQAGDIVQGESVPVSDPRKERADLYKTSKLKLVARSRTEDQRSPPWLGQPPTLATYRERGHRRLAAKTYDSKCSSCLWGCRMPVEMIIDHWNPEQRRYRVETFCYGPKSCSFYKAGSTRKVPGRRGMSWEEEDWIDEEATAHRGRDD